MSRNPQTPITPQTPLSFKTVPGRHRTQKWNKAPTYNYEGDDWGGYDEYDEYGTNDQELPPPMPMPQQQQQQAPYGGQQHMQPRGRVNSFDRGDETRQFSGPAPASSSTFPIYEDPIQRREPASAVSGGRGSNDLPRSKSRPRDFTNPEQVPQPLMTKASPTPNEWFPPRKSSLSGNSYENASAAAEARAIAEAVTAPNTDTEKPLPFIRPSDIYKRIPEEMRRQSEEGNRPSLESPQRQTSPLQPALTPVAEARESRLFVGDEVVKSEDPRDSASSPSTRSQLPSLHTGTIASSIQNTPTLTRPPPGHDPASEILAERQHDISVDAITNQNVTDLQHQPSQGFRSAVHHAFDQSDQSLSRDSSQSTHGGSGVSRSDTNSTTGISPIMSRVPSAATATMRQQRVDEQVPPIAEESNTTPTGSRPSSALQGMQQIPRKPSPGSHSRIASSDSSNLVDIQAGYRRSLDPPSSGASPARTPAVESTSDRRLSTPMSALPVTEAEAPDVIDQGAEVPEPLLQPVETPASEISDLGDLNYPIKPLPNSGRGRSGTDYSVREADIADTVNSAPEKETASLAIAEAQRTSQNQFLETHPTPTSPFTPAGQDLKGRTSNNGSRTGSPTKGRVREIADKFHEIHATSRRNSAASVASSKSSWSQFGGDLPRAKRQGTSKSESTNDAAVGRDGILASPGRPELGREESFRPDLPGGWISSAPTPSLESPPAEPTMSEPLAQHASPITPRAMQTAGHDEIVDLSPTTKKYQLQEGPWSATSPTVFETLKNAGAELGAALTSNVGVGHQTRDFGSAQPAAPVDQPEGRFKAPTGALLAAPPLMRQETDSTNAPTSVASSVAPTPLPKDTPKRDNPDIDGSYGYFNEPAPLRVRSGETSPTHLRSAQPLGGVGTLAPGRASSEFESDRLGDEIARSLESVTQPRVGDDTARTQNGLDARENARLIEQRQLSQASTGTGASNPGLIATRFSWEDRPQSHIALVTPDHKPVLQPQPPSPEIKPEAAYERPRSRALHVVNTELDSPTEGEPASTLAPTVNEPSTVVWGGPLVLPPVVAVDNAPAVSPMARSQEHLVPEPSIQAESRSPSLLDVAPSPVSDTEQRLPSYYLGDHKVDLANLSEKDHTIAAPMTQSAEPTFGSDRPRSSGTILPFKQILAMKTPDERIQTYNDTRSTFAGMNTGLGNWLSKMVDQHPEHDDVVSKPPVLHTTSSGLGTYKRAHKASPSIANFTNKFGQRSASAGGPNAGEDSTAARPTTQGGESSRVDMDKMQARGKEFMKSAGVFGGKASAGAKGLFAKGKSRFGSGSIRKSGNEVSSSSSTIPVITTPNAVAATATSNPLTVSTSASASTTPPAQDEGEHHHALTVPPYVPIESKPTMGVLAPPAPAPNELLIAPVPTPRPRSQTPASMASTRTGTGSRPMSQVLERLRSLSRKKSGSSKVGSRSASVAESHDGSARGGRSRSRPKSWVLGSRGDSLLGSETLGDMSDVAVQPVREHQRRQSSFAIMGMRSAERRVEDWEEPRDEATLAIGTAPSTSTTVTHAPTVTTTTTTTATTRRIGRVMSMASPARTESWNLPDARIPPKTPDHGRGEETHSMRLGILPSPAPTFGTVHEWGDRRASLEVSQRRESAAPFFKRGSADTTGEGGNPFVPNQLEIVESEAGSQQITPAEGEVEHQAASFRDQGDATTGDSDVVDHQAAALQDQETATTAEDEVWGNGRGTVRRYKIVNPGLSSPTSPQDQEKDDSFAEKPSPFREQTVSPLLEETVSRRSSLPKQDVVEKSSPGSAAAIPMATKAENEQVSHAATGANPAPEITPQRPRRVSDLQLLPSQRRRAPLNNARRRSLAVADPGVTTTTRSGSMSASGVEENASPVTVPYQNPSGSGNSMAVADEDELYNSTPMSARKMWQGHGESNPPNDADAPTTISTGHEDAIARMESEIAEAAAARGTVPGKTMLPPLRVMDASIPTATDEQADDDARSEVSAEERAAQEPLQPPHISKADTAASRRSSVSSLGMPDAGTVEAAEPTLQRYVSSEEPVMSSQAVPAGPLGTLQNQQAPPPVTVTASTTTTTTPTSRPQSRGSLSAIIREATRKIASPAPQADVVPDQPTEQQQRFVQRDYRPSIVERPLSYMPLPRDDSGALVQESITTGRNAIPAVQQQPATASAAMPPRTMPSPAPVVDSTQIAGAPTSIVDRPHPASVDLSAIAGPPPGAPPFTQHPAVRMRAGSGSVQPTEYEKLRSSDTTGALEQTAQSSNDLGSPRGGRNSTFFRGRPAQDGPPLLQGTAAPSASRISDQHGLEGVFHSRDDVHESQQPSAQSEKRTKKKSVIRPVFGRRSSSAAKVELSKESPAGDADASKRQASPKTVFHRVPAEEGPRPDRLRKPQRAVSSALETEPKKKRFSKLGSLFGRSNTTAEEKPRSNKLTKVASSRDSSMRVAAIPETESMGSHSIAGSFRGYEAYEAARRRDMPANPGNGQQPAAERVRGPVSPAAEPTLPHDVQPPPEGWYGPMNEPAPLPRSPPPGGWYGPAGETLPPHATAPHPQQAFAGSPPPEARRLHSSGHGPRRPLAQLPEAFRPVESSFNRPVQPIGPPRGHEPPFRNFSSSNAPQVDSFPPRPQHRQLSHPPRQQSPLPMQGAGPTERLDAMIDPHNVRQRQMSHVSNASHSSSNPISGRSEYYAQEARPFGSIPSVSPIRTREGSDGSSYGRPTRDHRVGSIGQEMARSPARDYPDQQTPWSVQVPARDRQFSNASRESRMDGSGRPTVPDDYVYNDRAQYLEQGPPPHLEREDAYGYRPGPPRGHSGSQSRGYVYDPDVPANEGRYPMPPPPPPQMRGAPPPMPRQGQIPWEGEQQMGPYPSPPYSASPPRGHNYHPRQEPIYDHLPVQHQYSSPAQYTHHPPPLPSHQRLPSTPEQGIYHPHPRQQQYPPSRYYSQGHAPRQNSGGDDRRATRSSSYAGRRDDRMVSEEEEGDGGQVVMRGSSYPGQEWTPEEMRWG